MRKKRVLAVLLALSLVVCGNGMTVLAAQQGADMPVSVSQEKTGEPAPEDNQQKEDQQKEETAGENTGEPTSGPSKPDETQEPSPDEGKPAEGEKPAEEGKPAEAGEEKPGEAGEEKPTEAEGEKPAEGGEPADPDAPGAGDGTEEIPGGGEATAPEGQEPADGEEAPVETDAETEKPEETPDQKDVEMQVYTSRMVTFTDDTGMRITYDANAELRYIYVVEDGVLTAVKVKSDAQEGGADTPVVFTGNVELKQPEEGEKYTSIASGVFSQNTDITYVKLPAGVETVGAGAFRGCTGLKGVYLPSSVTEIGDSAFEGCTALSQIAVPKTVTQIGANAFKGDARLHLVYVKDVDYCDLRSIGAHAFEGCSVLSEFCSDTEFLMPTKLESIGESAFQGCKAIRKLDFSKTKLAAMGAGAFQGCTGLTDLSLDKNLTLLPEHAFDGCSALAAVNFVNGENITIDRCAFANCYNIKQLKFPQSVVEIKEHAFQGCTKLTRVEIGYDKIRLDPYAFPKGEAAGLVIIANEGSSGYDYARDNGLLPQKDVYYKYVVEDASGTVREGGKFPGGSVWAGTADQTAYEKNINTSNNKQGVKSGSEKYYIYYQPNEGYKFNADALRCNGQPMQKEDGKYYFTMPEGGVVITAEFLADTPDNIKGKTVTVEFSAGTPLQNGMTDEYGYLGVELKVGQTTRMFLLDEDGETIPATKISKISSSDEKVATVNKNGVITAVGTGGGEKADAKITAVVKGGDSKEITINRTISVTTAEAKAITLKASGYPENTTSVQLRGEADGIQTLAITKGYVSARGLSFTLKANVYDGMEGISKELTWTTSNAKVAAIENAKTSGKNPANEVTVPNGCEGEATITVTANNAPDAEKEKVTQKFVVQVYQDGYKLASSSVTVNPNEKDGGTIELISAYNKDINDITIKLYEEKNLGTPEFVAAYDADASSANCKRFHIKPVAATIKNGTYKIRVGVNGDVSEKNLMPLTVTVKRDTPKPTIKFNSTKAKFNLFYKDGRLTADSEPTLVTTEISKLGTAEIEKVKLEPLSTKDDDKLFTENFVIDETADYGQGKVVIRRSEGNLKYTSKKKAAVTGYLVIYYKGYEDSAAKKMKVTMPTCTTAPSYALRETKGTYRENCGLQSETLEIYDKKSKTKERVALGSQDKITEELDELILSPSPQIQEDGTIAFGFFPAKGRLKLVLRNQNWDLDKNGKERTLSFTYSVSVSGAKPTIKTNPRTVTLNRNYPEAEVPFTLVSNQKGVEIGPSQTFEPVLTKSNESEIGKISVSYTGGEGTVIIKDPSVKKGTYKFECVPQTDYPDLKKFTLSVKVVDTKPSVKLGKGSLQLNRAVFENNNMIIGRAGEKYVEITELPYTVSVKPEGYTLAPVGTGENATEIKCTTKGKDGAESHLVFSVSEGDPEEKASDILSVSLKDETLDKGTYTFRMTQRYTKKGMTTVSAKPVSFKVKVIDTNDITLTVKAKGKINLVNREGEANSKNGIVYTPTLKNIKGEITDVKIYDAGNLEQESKYFDIAMIEEGKDKGKFFVTPKKTMPSTPEVPSTPSTEGGGGTPETPGTGEKEDGGDTTGSGSTSGTPSGGGTGSTGNTGEGGSTSGTPGTGDTGNTEDKQNPPEVSVGTEAIETGMFLTKSKALESLSAPETVTAKAAETPAAPGGYEYADLNYNQNYSVYIWVKVDGYAGSKGMNGGVLSKAVKIKTAQALPKVTTNKSTLDVYLSTKDYDASFVVKPKDGSVGTIQEVAFGEKDETARESFTLIQVPQADGSMKVIVHLQEAVGFANGTSNNVKMYVKYKGQGANTPETATSFTMKINVH